MDNSSEDFQSGGHMLLQPVFPTYEKVSTISNTNDFVNINNIDITQCSSQGGKVTSDDLIGGIHHEADPITVKQLRVHTNDDAVIFDDSGISKCDGKTEELPSVSELSHESRCQQILQLCESEFPKHIKLLQDVLHSTLEISGEEVKATLGNVCDRLVSETLKLRYSITDLCNGQPKSPEKVQVEKVDISVTRRLRSAKIKHKTKTRKKRQSRGHSRFAGRFAGRYVGKPPKADAICTTIHIVEDNEDDDGDYDDGDEDDDFVLPNDRTKKSRKTSVKFYCEVCDETFINKYRYRTHMLFHNENPSWKCEICSQAFVSKHRLQKHQKKHNPSNDLTCEICDKNFNEQSSLDCHRLQHDGIRFNCLPCGKSFVREATLRQHNRVQHPTLSSFMCSLCGQEFKTNQALTYHENQHSGDGKLRDRKQKNKSSNDDNDEASGIKKTVSNIPLESPQYQCEYCDRSFKYKQSLQGHIRIHTGERPYICDTCGKAFSRSGNLKVHYRRHSGLRPFVCKLCGSSFFCNSGLRSHMVIHTGERKYMCNLCGKRFGHLSVLKFHVNVHKGEKPFSCSDCEMFFQTKCRLTRHMLVHTKEQKYKCEVCGKPFGQKYNLRVHMRIHTGLKPYPCTKCGQCFTYNQTLQQHVPTCTGRLENDTTPPENRLPLAVVADMCHPHPGQAVKLLLQGETISKDVLGFFGR